MKRSVVPISATVILATLSGCASLRDTLPPMERFVQEAKESAREPASWGPIAAAAVISAVGSDNAISEWAADHTPIFGSQKNASRVSDDLRDTLVVGMALSSVFAPIPSGVDDTYLARRVSANALAFGTLTGVVAIGKATVRRDRPNDRDDKSFPSGHSSAAFSSAYLIEQNLNATVEQPWLRKSIKIGSIGSAAAVAWARVEAEEHHVVDVLVSAGLSNLFVKTFYRSMVSEEWAENTSIDFEAGREGFMLRLGHSF